MARTFIVGRVDELDDGDRLLTTVNGRSIGVFRVNGAYYALRNRCPHQGAELCKGDVLGFLESSEPGEYRFDPARKLLVCPWHGWEFDLATGQSYFDPQRTRVRRYDVEVRSASGIGPDAVDERGLTPGPYVAEVYPVTVEDQYLIVTMP